MYEILASFAQTGGLLFFMTLFGLVLFYALRPGAQSEFTKASQQPLNDDGPLTDAAAEDAR